MRQKRDEILVVFSVILLLLIAGCEGGKPVAGAPTTPFMGGAQGLEIGFVEGLPPDEVTDGGYFDFQAMVRLKNLGEYKLTQSQVKVDLVGFLPSDFGASAGELKGIIPKDELTPKQRDSEGNVIEPVETYVIFPGEGRNFNFRGSLAGNTPFTFRADVCYKYQTKATSEICVLGNMIDAPSDAICKPSEPKTVFSSGSPIQVTSFRQNVIGKDKIQFSFDIVHSGSGSIFDATTDAYCPKDSTSRRTMEDKVKVIVDTGLVGTNCVGLSSGNIGFVKLINGKRTITCTQTIGANIGDYKKSINIKLDFNYLDSVDKIVLVKHLLGAEGGTGSSTVTGVQGAPTVTISQATAITATSARLSGIVNPKGLNTDVWFKCGTDGSQFPIQTNPYNTASSVEVMFGGVDIGVFTPGTRYYCMAVAKNIITGTITNGNVISFTTGTTTLSGCTSTPTWFNAQFGQACSVLCATMGCNVACCNCPNAPTQTGGLYCTGAGTGCWDGGNTGCTTSEGSVSYTSCPVSFSSQQCCCAK